MWSLNSWNSSNGSQNEATKMDHGKHVGSGINLAVLY